MTILEALKGINPYPIALRTLNEIAERRGVSLDAEPDFTSRAYKLSVADVYKYLAYAPNVSQGGQSYSFSEEQRKHMLDLAKSIYDEEEEEALPKTRYGYKGSRL
jgi:hypothetical protein